MVGSLLDGEPSPRTEIIFEVTGSVRFPTILSGDTKLMGDKLFNIRTDPTESTDIAAKHPALVKRLKSRLAMFSKQRPPLSATLGEPPLLMDPPLPYVYGRDEHNNAPDWLKRAVLKVRATQPKVWAPGKTPWPQAPIGGKIIYTGDGR